MSKNYRRKGGGLLWQSIDFVVKYCRSRNS
jgi:hypothetical protein